MTVGSAPHPLYSVFEAADGSRAVVVANHSDDAVAATVAVEGHSGALHLATPEAPEPVASSGSIDVPARSVVVVIAGKDKGEAINEDPPSDPRSLLP